MIFQDYHLLNDRNLFENIALPLHVIGYDRDEIIDLVTESLEEVGLDGKENHFPNEFSWYLTRTLVMNNSMKQLLLEAEHRALELLELLL